MKEKKLRIHIGQKTFFAFSYRFDNSFFLNFPLTFAHFQTAQNFN